jgi:hypothetical protein
MSMRFDAQGWRWLSLRPRFLSKYGSLHSTTEEKETKMLFFQLLINLTAIAFAITEGRVDSADQGRLYVNV